METRDKAIRAQDIQTGLQGLADIPGLIEAELDMTTLTGMAGRLATHIRGVDVFEEGDIQRLKYVADSLGIKSLNLPPVLNILQEAEVVNVQNTTGGRIKRVRENIPTFGDLYTKLGTVYENSDRTEIEDALLTTVHRLAESPNLEDNALPILTVDNTYRSTLLDVADQAGLIQVAFIPETGKAVYYNPQYWDENVGQIALVIEKHGDENLRTVIRKIHEHQGMPVPNHSDHSNDAELLRLLSSMGMLPTPTVTGSNGEVAFAFTPFKSTGSGQTVETKILEKTRAIIACVRYGESFASITTVRNPTKLLNALQNKGRVGPHSEIYNQYRLLINQGVCRVSRDLLSSNRFILHFIDTDENKVALAAAIDILEAGIPLSATDIDQELKNYIMDGNYQEPATIRAKRRYTPTQASLKALKNQLIDILVTY